MYWYFLFFLSVLLLFLLPLLPAILEWRYKKDAQPLKVRREYDGNIAHFAQNFQQFLQESFASFSKQTLIDQNAMQGTLKSGERYHIIDASTRPKFSAKELKSNITSQLILGQASLQLPDTMFFEKEVFAHQNINSGNWNVFRAILAKGDIHLKKECDVIRWAHSGGNFTTDGKTRLFGRVSAEGRIQLSTQTRFGRLHAPHIQFGSAIKRHAKVITPITKIHPLECPDKLLDNAAGRWLVGEAMHIHRSSFHRGSIVSQKAIAIKHQCFIIGSIKSNRSLKIEGNSRIDGALLATKNIYIGPGSFIKGPIACEKKVVIAKGSIIGSPGKPTTITAPYIMIEEGVVIHGAVWARKQGIVVAHLSVPKKK